MSVADGHGDWTHDHGYFFGCYADAPDPWGFDDRWYERRKHDLTVAALPDERYRRGLEPGCANGALTERLADRCDELVAFDLVPACVDRARRRLADRTGTTVLRRLFPDFWPDGHGDLVVWSEVAYYLRPPGRSAAEAGLHGWLEPGGTLIAAHYTGETDYPMTAGEAHAWVDSFGWLRRRAEVVDESFELVVWQRT